jgi:hypothetical protein
MNTVCILLQSNFKMMSFFTTSGALDPSNQRLWNETKEIYIIRAHLTQGLCPLVLTNLLSSRDLELLHSPFIQCIASITLSIILPLSRLGSFVHGLYLYNGLLH